MEPFVWNLVHGDGRGWFWLPEAHKGSIPRDFADWSPNPEQIYGQSELGDILRKTINGLPPGFRTVFTLRDIETCRQKRRLSVRN